VTRSNYSGRSFEFVCPGSGAQDFVEAVWLNPIKKETYRSLYGCNFVRYQNSKPKSTYYPQWNSLTPTATIKVSRGRQAEHFVIVSRHGRARVSASPPKP
jgi:hypothetical protein